MDNKILIFMGLFGASLFIILMIVSIPISLLSPPLKILLLIIGLLLDVMAFSSRYYGYLIVPMLKQHRRRIVLSNENAYWLSGPEDSILHREGDDYTATVYVKIPLYGSATEMNDNEKLNFAAQLGRLASLSPAPIRYTNQLHVLDKDSYLRVLRDMINQVDEQESKMLAGEKVNEPESRIKGKSSMWHRMLDKVSGTTSFELMAYASASGKGTKDFEAANAAQQRARELMSAIAAVYGVTPSIITGAELLKFLEPEHLIPYSTVSEQITKTLREQVA